MWWKQLWFDKEGREGRVALVSVGPGGKVWSASASAGKGDGPSCNPGFCCQQNGRPELQMRKNCCLLVFSRSG